MSLVKTPTGSVEGFEENGAHKFLGVPYAKPPVGELRFRHPEPYPEWTGVLSAKKFGPVAPQNLSVGMGGSGGEVPNTSEDCLTLNVFTPSPDGKRRPVMVWFHGGGFVAGTANFKPYDGGRLAIAGDVVVVTVNYRLGMLGFADFSEFGDDSGSQGMLGFLDMKLALEWVRDHVANFGGDPDNVTIFGESAGGNAVSVLLVSPLTKGLFHRAISQSGCASITLPFNGAQHRARELVRITHADSIDALRSLSLDKILSAQNSYYESAVETEFELMFLPNTDSDMLSATVCRMMNKGAGADVPYMIGTTRHEYWLWKMWQPTPSDDRIRDFFETYLPGSNALEVYQDTYPDYNLQELYYALKTDYFFRVPSKMTADAHSKNQSDTYRYEFSWESRLLDGQIRSAHALEIDFIFGHLESPFSLIGPGDLPLTLSGRMQQAWASFARNGNPSCDAIGDWPSYSQENPVVMQLDSDCKQINTPPQAIIDLYTEYAYKKGAGGYEN